MKPISSWGRLSADLHQVTYLYHLEQMNHLVAKDVGSILAHGMGRSYGDVCLNPNGNLWVTTNLDHFISFNSKTGRLICESGVLLKTIQDIFIPQGWMLPVTPGTQFVTVGGAVANDVHGKNHHVFGTFGDHVKSIHLIRTTGESIVCSPHEHSEWFAATVGGLGLTGLITVVELALRPVSGPWLESETLPYSNLGEFFTLADQSESEWEYTVSWIDCLSNNGRGIFMRANHSSRNHPLLSPKNAFRFPFQPSFSLINRWSLGLLNQGYYYRQKQKAGESLLYYLPFFYPLDGILEWNKLYGPKGFYQYQMVIPRQAGEEAIKAMLNAIKKAKAGSFLAVLKTFGNRQATGLLSFPHPVVTLALDFPNQGEHTTKLFAHLDAIVREAKGRIYCAKDASMPIDLFQSGYPNYETFLQYRDPGISSGLSRRLMGY